MVSEEFLGKAISYKIRSTGYGSSWEYIPKSAGIYAIMESEECVYIGHTGNLNHRIKEHIGTACGIPGLRERLIGMRKTGNGRILFMPERFFL